jgi:hypothetical protein
MLRRSMQGIDEQQSQAFSYFSPEARERKDHPLRAIRAKRNLTSLSIRTLGSCH